MRPRALSFLTFFAGAAGATLVALLLLSTPKPAAAQAAEQSPCRQWLVAMFSVNFSDYIRLDPSLTDENIRGSALVLPPGWEPVDVDGGFAALVPAKRCIAR